MTDLEADAQAIEASNDQLKQVGELAQKAEDLKAEVDALEQERKARKAELDKLLNNDLPAVMDEAGLSEFKTSNGRKIKVEEVVSASIPKARLDEALSWLREQGHGDLIKHELKVSLGKGSDNIVPEVKNALWRDYGLDPTDSETVHSQTLSAFCREQMANGVELPEDLLGLYAARVAKLK